MKKLSSTFLVASLLVVAGAPFAQAELIVGLTNDNRITLFDSLTPGAATAPISITGLGAGETMVGIDRRPQNGPNNGLLYGLSISAGTGRIYTINEASGAATLVSTLSLGLNPSAGASGYGIDFNPVPDRLRVVNTADQNLRINVDTGATLNDGTLAYAAGDPNFGANPNIVAVAYNNNFGGATTTTLRDVDSLLDLVAIQNPPNNGTLNTATSLGLNTTDSVGYDVSGLTGAPYFSFILAGESFSRFYTFNFATQTFNFVGTVGTGLALLDIAAPVGVPTPEGGAGLLGLLTLGLVAFVGTKVHRRATA